MNASKLARRRQNEKVIAYARKVLLDCEKQKFTIADMKDLAEILPEMISEALVKVDESVEFNYLQVLKEFQNNNTDIHQRSFDIDHQ